MKQLKKLIKKIVPYAAYYKYLSVSRSWYSQVGQDYWVFGEAFNNKKNGFFIEIGSADGITLNNTFLLEAKYKWKGICIEANPVFYETLIKFRQSKCLNIAVDMKEDTVEFIQAGLSSRMSIIDSNDNIDGDVIVIPSKSLKSVLIENNAPKVIDYLSIDVEGAEERILLNFCFDEYRFNCITIERPSDKLRQKLFQNNYIVIKEHPGLDAFYIHKEFVDEYVKNALSFWKSKKSKFKFS